MLSDADLLMLNRPKISAHEFLSLVTHARVCACLCGFLFSLLSSSEFLEAEGLTEDQLRDACAQEMQAKDPGGLSFMHTLISSWEFSR